MGQDILIVDDEADIRDLVSGILEDEGYKPRTAPDGIKALEMIKDRQPRLVILDVWLGDSERDGLKILDIIKRDHAYVPVIMISGHSTIETAVSAIKKGAYDFIEKPFQAERLLLIIERAIESARLKHENETLRVKARIDNGLIGDSTAINQVRAQISRFSGSVGRVFISGGPGTDREALARDIHLQSKREKGPFLGINCGNLHPQQLETLLFGTDIFGQAQDTPRQIGLIERAHSGTLFLDEITLLPLPLQTKLVKVLQENSFYRIGGEKKIEVDVRFMGGSSHDTDEAIRVGDLREDLLYRLSATHIKIPSLKSRPADIPVLVEHYMQQAAAARDLFARTFSPEALIMLQSYEWPGDVQQLKSVVDWVLTNGFHNTKEPVQTTDLPADIISGNAFSKNWQQKTADIVVMPLREAREAFEREYLLSQVNRFGGNISQTARFVGMERSALHRKLRALGVHEGKNSSTDEDDFEQVPQTA